MKRSKKTLLFFSVFFILLGLVFAISFGLYGYKYYKIFNNRVRTYADIVEVNNKKGYTVIKYSSDTKTHQVKLNLIDSEFKEGGYVVVYYDKGDPDKSFIKDQAVNTLIMFVGGLICILVGIVFFIIRVWYTRKKNKLLREGKVVKATIKSYSINKGGIHLFKKYPYKIVLTYEEDGKKYTFKHNELWFDLDDLITSNNLKTFNVIVDPNNYDEYYIDLRNYKEMK